MCITFFMCTSPENGESQFPFVIGFNRDEQINREAEPLNFQDAKGYKNIICGIDVKTGTTWFAFNRKTGNFACLTNFRTRRNRELPKEYNSRGFVVMEFVKMDDPDIPKEDRLTYEEYKNKLFTGIYRGFNLLYGNVLQQRKSFGSSGCDLNIFQNQNLPEQSNEWQQQCKPQLLQNNVVYGLSNGNLNEWQKVIDGKKNFQDEYLTTCQKFTSFKNHIGGEFRAETIAELDNMMARFGTAIQEEVLLNDRRAWLQQVQTSDEGLHHEYMKSGTFVRNSMENYATVSSTVLIIHQSGRAYMQEHSYEHSMNFFKRVTSSYFGICGSRPAYDVKSLVQYHFDVGSKCKDSIPIKNGFIDKKPISQEDGPSEKSNKKKD